MSLSNADQDGFRPIDVHTLESFEEERVSRNGEAEPDFDRFKLLFEKPIFEEEETYEFEAIFDVKKEREEILFKPLIEPRPKPADKERPAAESGDPADGKDGLENSEESLAEAEPEETPEEAGYRKGFEEGSEAGQEAGLAKGYEEGFKKGETEGFAQGRKQGLEEGHAEGLEQGLKEGKEQGEAQALEKASDTLQALEDALNKAGQTLPLLVDTYEARIISLIEKIAQRAVMARVEIDDEIVRHMILDALKSLVQPEEVSLSVSPEDYEYIEMAKDDFFEQVDSLTSISVRSDPSVRRGACKIETLTASIESDPEERLAAIFEALKTAGIR